MAINASALRTIVLSGPVELGYKEPFWSLTSSAPNLKLKDVPEAKQEDRIHPVRQLALGPRQAGQDWRAPHLFSVHALVGYSKGHYAARQKEDESIVFALPKGFGQHDQVPTYAENGRRFRTRSIDAPPGEAIFQHVVASSLEGPKTWKRVEKLQQAGVLVLSLRVIGGAIDLEFDKNELAWLGAIKPLGRYFPIRLTPDGIEIETSVAFPGAGTKLEGRFLLTREPSGMALTLLPEALTASQREAWLNAWKAVTPDLLGGEVLQGFEISAERSMVPAFRWKLATNLRGEIIAPVPVVEVPAKSVRVELVSPRSASGVEGVAALEPDKTWLALRSALKKGKPPFEEVFGEEEVANKLDSAEVVLSVRLPRKLTAAGQSTPGSNRSRLWFESAAGQVDVALAPPPGSTLVHRCAHNEVTLAAALRRVYGLNEPRREVPEHHDPLLSAFVAMKDGWLQIPVPNVALPDPENDEDLIQSPAASPPNRLNGFLRYAQRGRIARTLSAFEPPIEAAPLLEETPWSVTVEGAQAITAAFAIKPESDQGKLMGGVALLEDPELAIQGVVVFSADRPNALEALPRLGAGPGAFIDVPIETLDLENRPVLGVELRALHLVAKLGEPADEIEREATSLSLFFDGKHDLWNELLKLPRAGHLEMQRRVLLGQPDKPTEPPTPPSEYVPPVVRWQRHPQMPLISGMPMTRSVLSAVQPLESRDLVPLVMNVGGTDATLGTLLAELSWGAGEVFPSIDERKYRSVAAWPWPPDRGVDKIPDRGIALVPLGVPGSECALPVAASNSGYEAEIWRKMDAAHRFDLPMMDEAFATAQLPPTPPDPSTPEERERPRERPAPTVHDWVAMKAFWQDQNRSHQLSRVEHSYLAGYQPIDTTSDVAVTTLIGNVTWKCRLGFSASPATEDLPYGSATIVTTNLRGDVVLRGHTGQYNIKQGKLEPGGKQVSVLGYSPSTFDEDGYAHDVRHVGSKLATAVASKAVVWRPIRVPNTGWAGLATIRELIEVYNVPPEGSVEPQPVAPFFWFKDLPLTKAGLFMPAPAPDRDGSFELKSAAPLPEGSIAPASDPIGSLEPSVWQDTYLTASGFEWRLGLLSRNGNTTALSCFGAGYDRMPFFGFELEPLRLQEVELKMSAEPAPANAVPTRVRILARLYLGEAEPRINDGPGNLVSLTLVPDKKNPSLLCIGAIELLPNAKPLSFLITDVKDQCDRERRLEVSGTPKWNGTAVVLEGVIVKIHLFGNAVDLPGAEFAPTSSISGQVEMTWPPKVTEFGQPKGGSGDVAITSAVFRPASSSLGSKSKLLLGYRVRLLPSTNGVSDTAHDAPLVIAYRTHGGSIVQFLGRTAKIPSERNDPVDLVEQDGAIGFTLRDTESVQPLIPGLPVGGVLSIGLVASLEPFANGIAPLSVGRFEGAVTWDAEALDARPPHPLKLECIAFSAQAKNEESNDKPVWEGELRFDGWLEVENTIRWPRVRWDAENIAIPYSTGTNGRTEVGIAPDEYFTHSTAWRLNGHRLSFVTASQLLHQAKDTVWTLLVAARHALMDHNGKSVSFTGVETIAIGMAETLIPKELDPVSEAKTGPVTFAPRYRDEVKERGDTKQKTPGMRRAGVGALGTVLQGAFGFPFRKACHAEMTPEDSRRLIVAGGFVGMLPLPRHARKPGQDVRASLLRLPVLAAVDPALKVFKAGMLQQVGAPMRGNEYPLEVAWADGPAALELVDSSRAAVAPGSAAESALLDALRAPPTGTSYEIIEWAVLVEQSFPVDLPELPWRSAPYFLSAAVSVTRALTELGYENPKNAPSQVLSFVASESVVAAVSTTMLPMEGSLLEPTSKLYTVGEDLIVSDWHAPMTNVGGDDAAGRAMVVARALADHVRPRAAMLAAARSFETSYVQFDLPQPPQRPRARSRTGQPAFADIGRGYCLPPVASMNPLGWLAAPEEGRSSSVRDDAISGVTARARDVFLPSHASASASGTGLAISEMVWISQSRVPIYLALKLKNLQSPPIGWLAPGNPRPRLPTEESLRARLFEHESAQAILPEEAVLGNIADRAGVLIARQIRLETALSAELKEFDPLFERFGRPAQAGSALYRTERSPRPGPLPENGPTLEHGPDLDPLLLARNRRPCASPLLPKHPLAVLVGPADTLRGEVFRIDERVFNAWSVTLVAAPETAGMVSDRWDGSLRLQATIDMVAPVPSFHADADDAIRTLFALLFEKEASSEASPPPYARLSTQATLVIGGTAISYRALQIDRSRCEKWTKVPDTGQANGIDIMRAKVSLILDTRDARSEKVPRAALPQIAEALNQEVVPPPVELHFTVQPVPSEKWTWPEPFPDRVDLTVSEGAPTLSTGSSRAPVTLRFALAPVRSSGAALPLVRSTLLFVDSAYDSELSSPPHEDMAPIAFTTTGGAKPDSRGALQAVLSSDRRRINRGGTATLMTDLRFEKRLDALSTEIAEQKINDADPRPSDGGDLVGVPDVILDLQLKVLPRDGEVRDVFVDTGRVTIAAEATEAPRVAQISIGRIYELSLSRLIERDRTAVRLIAGDALDISVSVAAASEKSPPTDFEVSLWNAEVKQIFKARIESAVLSRRLQLIVTDEPVTPPPPACYGGLVLNSAAANGRSANNSVAVPLYEQSPLPWRVDLVNARKDFRRGLMRRTASFVWAFARPWSERDRLSAFVVKSDRNGQTHIPSESSEFVQPRVEWRD